MARRYCGKVRIYLTYVDGRSPAHELGARPDGYEWRIVYPGFPRGFGGFLPHDYGITGMYAADSSEAYDRVASHLQHAVRHWLFGREVGGAPVVTRRAMT